MTCRPTGVLRLAAALAVALACVGSGAAQKLPGGTVQPKPVLRRPVKKTLSKQPTAALLIVVTTPKAAIDLNGKSVGQADADGQFEIEVAAGDYVVRASAGDDVVPDERRISLEARGREIVMIPLTSRFGEIAVNVPELAASVVLLDGAIVARFDADGNLESKAAVPMTVSADRERKTVTVGRVASGAHVLRYESPSNSPVEESVAVEGGATSRLTLRAGPADATVEVVSAPGTAVSLDGAQWGRTGPDGRFIGRGVAGNHIIRLEKPGYEPEEHRRVFEAGGRLEVVARLTPSLTRVGFGDDFELDLGRWDHPAGGWSIAGGALVVSGAVEPGLARGIRYGDFVFSFNLTMSSNGGGAWLLRARDSRNYYLFSLGGPSGRFPNRLAVYVVQDGKFDVGSPAVAPVPISSKLEVGGEFYVEIRARGNRIETRITPVSTGVAENLGEYVDPQNLFPTGGIGFRAVADERFEIDDAYADPP